MLMRAPFDVRKRIFPCTKVIINGHLHQFYIADVTTSIMNYANRMLVHDFDCQNGFTIDGGIKDAT